MKLGMFGTSTVTKRVLSLGLTIGGVGLVIGLIVRDIDAVMTLRQLRFLEVLWILALQGAYLITESLRMEIVVEKATGVPIRSWTWFRIFSVGRLINVVIPQGGNVYRSLALKDIAGIGFASFGGGMAAFLWLNVALNLAAASTLIILQPRTSGLAGREAWWVFGIATVVVVTVPAFLMVVARRINRGSRLMAGIYTATEGVMTVARSPSFLAQFLGIWIVTLLIIILTFRAILAAVGASIGLGEIVAVYALVQATSFVVITPGNFGIQELGLTGLLVLFGVPAAQAAAASMFIRISGLVVLAAVALPFLPSALRGSKAEVGGRVVSRWRKQDEP